MSIKKSPKVNLEDKRLTYILLGFVFALSVIYVAFEWTDRDVTVPVIENTDALGFVDEAVMNTQQDDTPPHPPEPEVPEVLEPLPAVAEAVATMQLYCCSAHVTA